MVLIYFFRNLKDNRLIFLKNIIIKQKSLKYIVLKIYDIFLLVLLLEYCYKFLIKYIQL